MKVPQSIVPRIILFDFGGVLIEWDGIAPLIALTAGRLDPEQARKFWLFSPAVRAFEIGQCSPEQFSAEAVRELDLPCTAVEFLRHFESWDRGPLPGAIELLGELAPRFTLACLSNNNELHWRRLQGYPGFLDRFQHAFVSFQIRRIKPDPEVYAYVLKQLPCAPEEILFLDDNPECIEAARRAGMQGEQVKGVTAARQCLEALGFL